MEDSTPNWKQVRKTMAASSSGWQSPEFGRSLSSDVSLPSQKMWERPASIPLGKCGFLRVWISFPSSFRLDLHRSNWVITSLPTTQRSTASSNVLENLFCIPSFLSCSPCLTIEATCNAIPIGTLAHLLHLGTARWHWWGWALLNACCSKAIPTSSSE